MNLESLKRVAKRAGVRSAYSAGCLWFVATDPATPRKIRAAALSPLAYFLLPLDAIPDLAPLIGFTDDAALMAAAVAALAIHVKPGHRRKARELVVKWFGEEAAAGITKID